MSQVVAKLKEIIANFVGLKDLPDIKKQSLDHRTSDEMLDVNGCTLQIQGTRTDYSLQIRETSRIRDDHSYQIQETSRFDLGRA